MSDDGEDTPARKHLREVVVPDIKAVYERHGVGGVAFVVSEEAALWHTHIPAWANLELRGDDLRIHLKGDTPDNHRQAERTMHLVGALRDMAGHFYIGWTHVWHTATTALKAQGADVEHVPFGGGPGPVGKHGKKG